MYNGQGSIKNVMEYKQMVKLLADNGVPKIKARDYLARYEQLIREKFKTYDENTRCIAEHMGPSSATPFALDGNENDYHTALKLELDKYFKDVNKIQNTIMYLATVDMPASVQ